MTDGLCEYDNSCGMHSVQLSELYRHSTQSEECFQASDTQTLSGVVNDAEKVVQVSRHGTGRQPEDGRVQMARVFAEMGVRRRRLESDGRREHRRQRAAGLRAAQWRARAYDAVRGGDEERARQQRQHGSTANKHGSTVKNSGSTARLQTCSGSTARLRTARL